MQVEALNEMGMQFLDRAREVALVKGKVLAHDEVEVGFLFLPHW